MIKYCFVYFVVHLLQLCPLEALSMGSCAPKPYPHHFVKHILSSCSWRDKTFQAQLHIAAPALNPACLQGVLVPLTGERYWKWRRVHCAHPVVFYLRASFTGPALGTPTPPSVPLPCEISLHYLQGSVQVPLLTGKPLCLPSKVEGWVLLCCHTSPFCTALYWSPFVWLFHWLSCLGAQTLFSASKKESDSERP